MKEKMNIKKGEERGEKEVLKKRGNNHGPDSIYNKRGDKTFEMHIRNLSNLIHII